MWSSIGVEVQLRQVEQATHITEALSGDYQIKCFRAGGDTDPSVTLQNAFGEGSPQNVTRFEDSGIHERIAELGTTDDVDVRKKLVEEIGAILNENVPMTYVGQTLASVAVGDHVKNV